jgi:sterol desaturase/sphingolipid hydroxylase (fatty acid hydroxylase superfamily)
MDDLPITYSDKGGFPIDHSDQPIRLFKSDFLEFFTHITPLAVVIIWLPVIIWLLWRSIQEYNAAYFRGYIPLCILFGIFFWTFAEYTLHRFVFHYHPSSAGLKRLVFLFHGIHHAQPQCKTRLVMPPAVSVPMAFIFYGLFYGVVGVLLGSRQGVEPLLMGFMTGYLIYDLIHYATHHFPMRGGALKFLKRYHMQHHYKTPDRRFGVSSPLWDKVFGTLPA